MAYEEDPWTIEDWMEFHAEALADAAWLDDAAHYSSSPYMEW